MEVNKIISPTAYTPDESDKRVMTLTMFVNEETENVDISFELLECFDVDIANDCAEEFITKLYNNSFSMEDFKRIFKNY